MPPRPETRYATVGESVSVAFQIVGDGPVDLIYVQGYLSNVDVNWEWEPLARFLSDLAEISRLIVMDPRGSGASERFAPPDVPPLESLMDDIHAVMEAAGSSRAIVFATEESGFYAIPFAATYPDRCAGLILWCVAAAWARDEELPWAWDDRQWEEGITETRAEWGREHRWRTYLPVHNPGLTRFPDSVAMGARLERATSTPTAVVAMIRRWRRTDVRDLLPTVHVPTLVMHAADDPIESSANAPFIAERIPGARLEILPGVDHLVFGMHRRPVVDHVRRFIADIEGMGSSLDRVLATVLFTDIVDSTAMAVELGDRRWRELVEQHHATVRSLLRRYRGTEIDTAGDGFFASFDGPARAVSCAMAVADAVEPLGMQIRAGVHTGEVETIDGKVGGMAVVIGARVASLASGSEVLVSRTVKDLVAGSGIVFEDQGEHVLKGIPEPWRLYRALPGEQPTRVSGA
jgi:class 3 adenylate cyclase/pimeloyl-ACP methyl ester carboxylesterase